jgi:hypothetical protein
MLADTKDFLPHPKQRIIGVGCVMTADTKDRSLVSVDISRHKKWAIFCITQRYRIQWLTPKIGYQLILQTVFVVVFDAVLQLRRNLLVKTIRQLEIQN